jgi:hypothetical protein
LHAQPGFAVRGVNHAWTHGQSLAGARVKRHEIAASVDNGDSAGNAPSSVHTGHVQIQSALLKHFLKRTRIEFDVAHDDVVILFGRREGEGIFTVPQGSRWHGQRVPQRCFHQEELADLASVEFNSPFEFHIILPNEKGRLACVALCGKTDIQSTTVGLVRDKLLPFRFAGRPEVIPSGVENTRRIRSANNGGPPINHCPDENPAKPP